MVKRLFWLGLLAAAVFLASRFGYPAAMRHFFRAAGTVTLAPDLPPGSVAPNSMLFVVARNTDGVPVAVKKAINPVFPLAFEMTSSDLIMPDLLTRTIYFEAVLNTHGQILALRQGDLRGSQVSGEHFISKGIRIELGPRQK